MNAYLIHLLTLLSIFAIAGMGLNVVLGGTGVIQLGYAGLMGIGAYVSAIAVTVYGTPFWMALGLAMMVPGAMSALLALLSKRVKGDALAIILLGFNFSIYAVTLNWTRVTRGPLGIPGIPRPELLHEDRFYLLFVLLLCGLVFLGVQCLMRSPFGRLLGAIRDDELHARVLGKRTLRTKVMVMALSGVLAGLAGALQAFAIRFIDPASFFVHQLVFVLSIIFLGGLASMRGTMLGALLMTFLPELVSLVVTLPSSAVGALRGIIFSLLLLLVVLYRPKGLLGKVELPSAYGDE